MVGLGRGGCRPEPARRLPWQRLRLRPSSAETERLLGILAFLEGEATSWLNRFLLTLVTSVEEQHKRWRRGPPAAEGEAQDQVLPWVSSLVASAAEHTLDLACGKEHKTLRVSSGSSTSSRCLRSRERAVRRSTVKLQELPSERAHSSPGPLGHLDLTKTLRRLGHAAVARQRAAPDRRQQREALNTARLPCAEPTSRGPHLLLRWAERSRRLCS